MNEVHKPESVSAAEGTPEVVESGKGEKEIEPVSEFPIGIEEIRRLIDSAEAGKELLEANFSELEEAIAEFDGIVARIEESNRKKPNINDAVAYERWSLEKKDILDLYQARLGVLKANLSILARHCKERNLQDWGLKFATVREISDWSLRVGFNKKRKINKDIISGTESA